MWKLWKAVKIAENWWKLVFAAVKVGATEYWMDSDWCSKIKKRLAFHNCNRSTRACLFIIWKFSTLGLQTILLQNSYIGLSRVDRLMWGLKVDWKQSLWNGEWVKLKAVCISCMYLRSQNYSTHACLQTIPGMVTDEVADLTQFSTLNAHSTTRTIILCQLTTMLAGTVNYW